jgi:hypothetical protein
MAGYGGYSLDFQKYRLLKAEQATLFYLTILISTPKTSIMSTITAKCAKKDDNAIPKITFQGGVFKVYGIRRQFYPQFIILNQQFMQ